jgi:carboxypeptidase Q
VPTFHTMKNILVSLFFTVHCLFPQSQNDFLARISQEGLQHSQAKEMLYTLTDVYGPRLTGSREYLRAAQWMAGTMKEAGLENVHFEPYCQECRGWSINSFNMELIAPNYMKLLGYPMAMSKGTPGSVEASLIHISDRRDTKAMMAKYTGKLRGKIVLYGPIPAKRELNKPPLTRHTEEELEKMEHLLVPEDPIIPLPESTEEWEEYSYADQEFLNFFEAEGVQAVLFSDPGAPGIMHTSGTYHFKATDAVPLPYFSLIPEHFGRLVRMLEDGADPLVRIQLDTDMYTEPENNVNIIGEMPGADPKLKDELVLVGGHFDSWHPATGATDNGVSCVVLTEALRILKTSGYQPRRTIRIGLWGGEEQNYYGSVSYAKSHFEGPDGKPNAASGKVAAYLNLDNGAGAIRGIYLQGNDKARPVFREIFEPLGRLGASTITIDNTFGTDHEVFDYYNIPAFQFIQDPLSYNTLNHHTQLDLPEYVPEDDLKKNAVILAWVIRSLADREKQVPRKL